MAWLMPFSLAIWNWLFSAAISCTSYLKQVEEWKEEGARGGEWQVSTG